MNGLLLLVVLVLIVGLLGSAPVWPHSASWGYYPSGLFGLLIVVIIILLLVGRLP